jgi:hypothetical protein
MHQVMGGGIIYTVTSFKASDQVTWHSGNILLLIGTYYFQISNGILATLPDVPNYFHWKNLDYNDFI